MRKHVVSVLGSNSAASDEALALAEKLGKAIVDNGWVLLRVKVRSHGSGINR